MTHRLAAGLGLLMAAAAAHADDTTPIRVQRAGYPNAAAYRQNVEVMVEACRAVKKLPPGPSGVPSVEVLAKLPLMEQEELFDGPMWALYETQREVAPDPNAGCKLATFVHRSVRIERSCEWRLRGSTALIGEQTDLEHPRPAGPGELVQEDGASPECRRKPRERDTSDLKAEDAGFGARCFWASDMIRASMAKVGMKPGAHDPRAVDFCHYDKHPYYQVGGLRRSVVLKSRGELHNDKGTALASFFGAVQAAGVPVLTGFSDGTRIDPARFTKAAAQAFLAQPAKLPPP